MIIDIDETLKQMVSTLEEALGDGWKKVSGPTKDMLHRQRERFEMLSQMRTEGLLTEEEFQYRLEEQKKILEANMEAIKLRGKTLAQKAANAAIEVFEKAVHSVI